MEQGIALHCFFFCLSAFRNHLYVCTGRVLFDLGCPDPALVGVVPKLHNLSQNISHDISLDTEWRA